MDINLSESKTGPTPSPSPGPSPIAPPKGWQVPLDPPPRASKALADYVVAARRLFQELVDTLGTPRYAVPPPVVPPAAPPLLPAGATSPTGAAAASYASFQDVLRSRSAAWHGTDSTAIATAREVATIGSAALQQIQDLVHRLQDVLNAASLDRTVPAAYTKRPSTDVLASYAEYQLVLTVERTLQRAIDVLMRAQEDLGDKYVLAPLTPAIPVVPEGMLPPEPVPMPELQWPPRNQGTMEV
ncbi:hypothetical protein [Nocardia exalbida]|uniref:hypothetical protein n=1 Tax=Nocardia exalbida TaxID=290231 RepID=UPI0002DEFCAF|nr:hypothetical protein [Nocardia exalbida]